MPRLAAIDIGTNSVKLTVLEIGRNKPRSIHEEAVVTRLGEGVRGDGRLRRAAIQRTLKIIRQFQNRALRLGAPPALIATEALRKARNRQEFIRGLDGPLRILSRHEEAKMSYLGAKTFLRNANAVMVDIGGGTIELLVSRRDRLVQSATLPLGCVYLTEHFLRHDPPQPREWRRLESHIERRLARFRLPKSRTLVGIGGSVATVVFSLSRRKTFDSEKFNGSRIAVSTLREIRRRWSEVPTRVRIRKYRVDPKRADVILAAVAVLLHLADRVGAREIVVCTYGVRHGVLLSAGQGPSRRRLPRRKF